MRKRLIFPAVLAVSLAMFLTGVSIYANAWTTTENAIETGAVRIRIEPEEKHFENILPGQLIDVTPVIKNEGYDCFIRTTVETDELQEYLTAKNIPEEWMHNEADGYWYYRKIVKNGETVTLFDGLYAEPDLPQEFPEDKQIRLRINAEAVQAVNFTPDFDGIDPWGGIQAEAFAGNEIDTKKQGITGSKGLFIRYEGKADRLIADPKDFFSNLPVLMPGDSFEQTIRLNNDAANTTGLYFYTEAQKGRELLEKITLKIKADGKLMYYGTLASPELEGEDSAIRLLELEKNGSGECTFSVSVPKSLKNEFSLKDSSFAWIFSTKDKTVTGETPKSPTGSQIRPVYGKSVSTGDGSRIGLYLMMFGIAMLGLAAAAKRIGSRKEEQ